MHSFAPALIVGLVQLLESCSHFVVIFKFKIQNLKFKLSPDICSQFTLQVRAENGWDSATLPYLAHEVQGLHHRQQQQQQQPHGSDIGNEAFEPAPIAAAADAVANTISPSAAPSADAADEGEGAAFLWEYLPSWHVSAFILKTG